MKKDHEKNQKITKYLYDPFYARPSLASTPHKPALFTLQITFGCPF